MLTPQPPKPPPGLLLLVLRRASPPTGTPHIQRLWPTLAPVHPPLPMAAMQILAKADFLNPG